MEENTTFAVKCLDEFTQPEKELRKLKLYVTISIALTIPIVIFSLPHMLPAQFSALFPMYVTHYSNYIMLALATPLQFWIGGDFTGDYGMELTQGHLIWTHLLQLEQLLLICIVQQLP